MMEKEEGGRQGNRGEEEISVRREEVGRVG